MSSSIAACLLIVIVLTEPILRRMDQNRTTTQAENPSFVPSLAIDCFSMSLFLGFGCLQVYFGFVLFVKDEVSSDPAMEYQAPSLNDTCALSYERAHAFGLLQLFFASIFWFSSALPMVCFTLWLIKACKLRWRLTGERQWEQCRDTVIGSMYASEEVSEVNVINPTSQLIYLTATIPIQETTSAPVVIQVETFTDVDIDEPPNYDSVMKNEGGPSAKLI